MLSCPSYNLFLSDLSLLCVHSCGILRMLISGLTVQAQRTLEREVQREEDEKASRVHVSSVPEHESGSSGSSGDSGAEHEETHEDGQGDRVDDMSLKHDDGDQE